MKKLLLLLALLSAVSVAAFSEETFFQKPDVITPFAVCTPTTCPTTESKWVLQNLTQEPLLVIKESGEFVWAKDAEERMEHEDTKSRWSTLPRLLWKHEHLKRSCE